MRGKVHFTLNDKGEFGITPAYAGKSLSKLKGSLKRGDHPRLCGEKPTSLYVWEPHGGSPPPMRGKVMHQCFIFCRIGITPAYAGKSLRHENAFVRC